MLLLIPLVNPRKLIKTEDPHSINSLFPPQVKKMYFTFLYTSCRGPHAEGPCKCSGAAYAKSPTEGWRFFQHHLLILKNVSFINSSHFTSFDATVDGGWECPQTNTC